MKEEVVLSLERGRRVSTMPKKPITLNGLKRPRLRQILKKGTMMTDGAKMQINQRKKLTIYQMTTQKISLRLRTTNSTC